MRYLTADFGSTYTKVTAIDTDTDTILGTGAAFTTIDTDVTIGLNNAVKDLVTKIGEEWQYEHFLCCSSAAGGLKMVASGLVPDLTAKASRMAAASAGAKVVKTYAYEISESEAKEIEAIAPDLILLCGGTDGGNKETILKNAETLSKVPGKFTLIIAGNKSAEVEIKQLLDVSGKSYVLTENVMPDFNTLNIEPAKKAIMRLFIESIIHAKGLSKVQQMAHNEIIPTPLAVLNACELLSQGTHTEEGIGELLAVDLGGATTDVYSIAKGEPSAENIMMRGIPEPFSKRTVEGDLGMRYSLSSLSEESDHYLLAQEVGVEESEVNTWIQRCLDDPSLRAQTERESLIERALAKSAVKIATDRHAGHLKGMYTPMGQVFTISGKDLSNVPNLIGIGGALIHSANPKMILSGASFDMRNFEYAKPKAPKYFLDKTYIMASMGLLSGDDPNAALRIMKKYLYQL